MKRFAAAAFALFLAFGCAKDKGQPAPASRPADALSSNAPSPCAQIGTCQRAPESGPEATATSTSTVTSTGTSTGTSVGTELNDTQKMAKNAQVTCKNGDCDPSVGLLSIVIKENNAWNAGQCTASLVGPDVLATNGHCIPPDLIEPGSSCRNRLWITFAKDPKHPEYDVQLDCDQVLFRHKDPGMDGADYAYLKLARASNRPVLPLSQAGFESGKTYHVHKVNPGRVQGGVMGMLEKVPCRTLFDSALFSAPLDPLSQTILFVDCNVIPGNSGSPIFADDGTVRGVIYAFVKKEQIHGVFEKGGSSVPRIEDIADLNTGSNFACLATPADLDAKNLSPACANPQSRLAEKRAAYAAARVSVLRPAALKEIRENEAGHPDIEAFGWNLALVETNEAAGTLAQGVPACVNDSLLAPVLQPDATLHRPTFTVRYSYDKYLRAVDFVPVWGGFARTAESLLVRASAGHAYQVRIDDRDSGQTAFDAMLGKCGEQ